MKFILNQVCFRNHYCDAHPASTEMMPMDSNEGGGTLSGLVVTFCFSEIDREAISRLINTGLHHDA